MKYLLILPLFFLASTVVADVYMDKDAQGNIIYSDTPLSDQSEKIDTPEETTDTSSSSSSFETHPQALPETLTKNSITTTVTGGGVIVTGERKPYVTFTLVSPKNQETIQNQPNIKIVLNVEPALQEGDQVQLMLDGTPLGTPIAAISFDVSAPNRGTHTVSAKLLNKEGVVLKQTSTNTIFVHQAALGDEPINANIPGVNPNTPSNPATLPGVNVGNQTTMPGVTVGNPVAAPGIR